MKKETRVKIYRRKWSCLDCQESIEYYPDIKVVVLTDGCVGENHFCSSKCLKNYVNNLSLIDSENPEGLYYHYNNSRHNKRR